MKFILWTLFQHLTVMIFSSMEMKHILFAMVVVTTDTFTALSLANSSSTLACLTMRKTLGIFNKFSTFFSWTFTQTSRVHLDFILLVGIIISVSSWNLSILKILSVNYKYDSDRMRNLRFSSKFNQNIIRFPEILRGASALVVLCDFLESKNHSKLRKNIKHRLVTSGVKALTSNHLTVTEVWQKPTVSFCFARSKPN